MTSAHLKTLREHAGLTMEEASALAGVSLRSWQRWEAPDYDGVQKADVLDALMGAADLLDRMIENSMEALADLADGVPIRITRYRTQAALDRNHPDFPYPLSVHNAYVRELLALLLSEGKEATVVWDNDPTAAIGQDFR